MIFGCQLSFSKKGIARYAAVCSPGVIAIENTLLYAERRASHRTTYVIMQQQTATADVRSGSAARLLFAVRFLDTLVNRPGAPRAPTCGHPPTKGDEILSGRPSRLPLEFTEYFRPPR